MAGQQLPGKAPHAVQVVKVVRPVVLDLRGGDGNQAGSPDVGQGHGGKLSQIGAGLDGSSSAQAWRKCGRIRRRTRRRSRGLSGLTPDLLVGNNTRMNAATTREQLVCHAQALIRQRGYNGFSYRDLAEHVGVKTASIHYY